MTIILGMHEKSHAYIGPRLAALKLDVEVRTFDSEGIFTVGGKPQPAAETDIDYLWLSSHVGGPLRDAAFKVAFDCRKVGVLQTFNAGLDHPFYKALSDKGTRICNSSAQGVAIAEYTLAQVLAVLQPIEQQRALQAQGLWKQLPFREVSETRWLIIGFGPIGQELAKRVKAFGAGVSVIRRSPVAADNVDQVGTSADTATFLGAADIVVLACPVNDQTRGMADAAFFGAMKKGAILVNIARGALVDDAAMLQALDAGTIGTAVLDVFHTEPLPAGNPLWTHPSVRMTSHTSFFGSGVRARWDALFLDNIARFAKGLPLASEVAPRDIG